MHRTWAGGWARDLRVTLQVRWADGQLTGYWADDHLWDDVDLRSPASLVVRGFRIGPGAGDPRAVVGSSGTVVLGR